VKRVKLGAFALGGAALATAGVVAWQANAFQQADVEAVTPDEQASETPPPAPTAAESEGAETASTAKTEKKAAAPVAPLSTAETPMGQRIAVLGLLNKRNGVARELTLRPGQVIRLKDVIVHLSACETTADWEDEQLTGAFVQLDVRKPDGAFRRAFSGWLYKETPSLNAVEDPVYDVWPKSCKMAHPDIGPDTVRVSGSAAQSASSAKKSAGDQKPAAAAPAAPTPIAESSNPT
jgi:hypothetical protein